ncbi:MAG: hypothetical protein AAGG51_11650 [Cyanobacteria bacterium P01_G01_bin.54]
MLNLDTIQQLATTYSCQEIFAALVWQRRFNEFNGQEVITDLVDHPEIWASFIFTKPIYAPDPNGLSFNGLLDTLLALANYRPMPEESIMHFIPYPADTLYILAENQDIIVAQLMDLGKKWRADEVGVYDDRGVREEEPDWEFRDYVAMRLKRALWGQGESEWRRNCPAVIVSYWWD